jgi:methionyl-tRNA formyltransferase
MEIAILTQNNGMLINGATRALAENLARLGFRLVIFRTTATAKGKPTSKLDTVREVLRFFGPVFTLRAILTALLSMLRDRPSRFPKGCRIIEVPDDQKMTEAYLRQHCTDFHVLLILAGTRIIRKDVLEMWEHGVLNVHSSILPYARGVMPALWTWINRTGLGVTLFRLDEGIDTGEVILQAPIQTPAASYFGHLVHTKQIGVQLITAWVTMTLLQRPDPGSVEDVYFTYPEPDFRLRR